MKTDEKGIALLKDLEGLRTTAYRCSADRLTIGYGHTSNAGAPVVVPGQKITKDEAERILRRDIAYFETELAPLIKHTLSQNQWNAIVSFAFNVGIPAFEGSTLLKKINAGELEAVPAEMMKWTKYLNQKTKQHESLPGLVTRRRAETGMWRSLDEKAAEVKEGDTRQQPVPPAPIRKPLQSKEAVSSITSSVAGGLIVAKEVKSQLDDASSLLDAFFSAMKSSTFIIAMLVVVLGIAVYTWRTKRLREDETA